MRGSLLPFLFLPFFVAGVMGQPSSLPMEVWVSKLEFENMEQWTAAWQGENVLMASMERAVLKRQAISSGFLRLRVDNATVENLLMCAKSLVSDGSHFENLTMYTDPRRGHVIRIRRGWMENVRAPTHYLTIKSLRHENLGVAVS